ncbi:MAG: FKBP-type peptidyl-prolyl cis-trans isomerase [Chromatiaceae bacterium]|nr:FKBP-type peptidyl-prolyl cis-trans isomerase [Gammaproteobacteria bacterium]MCP5313877.1 FKBP-type peptidyl-prolyl cis-trans isomerase [Chromatiaceae bacterium]
MQEIFPGCDVTLHLAIALEDGTEAISTFGEEPLSCTLGDGTLQPGLELALYGLRAGDTQTISLLPEQAYGLRDPALIQYMPMTDFDGAFTPEIGQIIAFTLPDGDEAPGSVIGLDDGRIEIDFNHPLAGHEITLRVEILSVSPPASV